MKNKIWLIGMLLLFAIPVAMADTYSPVIESWVTNPCIDQGGVQINTKFDIDVYASACDPEAMLCLEECNERYATTASRSLLENIGVSAMTLSWYTVAEISAYEYCVTSCLADFGGCDDIEMRAVLFYGNASAEVDSGWVTAEEGYFNLTNAQLDVAPSHYKFTGMNTTNVTAGWRSIKIYARVNESAVTSQLLNVSMGATGW